MGRSDKAAEANGTKQPKKRAHIEPEEEEEELEEGYELEEEAELDSEDEGMELGDEDGEEEEALLEMFTQAEIIEDMRKAGEVKSGKAIAEKDRELETAADFMQWLIAPMTLEKFYSEYWEKKPFVIQRKNCRGYYNGWFGKDDVIALLRTGKMLYGKNVDVTNYVDNERVTLNKDGAADADEVLRNFEGGCSVRVLHPQRWSDPLWLMLSTLERHWESVVGCNTYLTPPGSQGFSPHFDDIEAFVLQTEGRKHWRCYAPREGGELLPRVSSPNFLQEDIGEPVLEFDLEAGDLLYMPRGTIHQANCLPDSHSMHITVSTGQQNTWADFLAITLPRALELAAEEHVELRRSVPRDVLNYMGVVHSDSSDTRREEFVGKMAQLFSLMLESAPWDPATDQLGAMFQRARLPPVPLGGAPRPSTAAKVGPDTKVRLAHPGCARLVVEGDSAVVYHMMRNPRDLHCERPAGAGHGEGEHEHDAAGGCCDGDEKPPGAAELGAGKDGEEEDDEDTTLEFPVEWAPGLELLLLSYPTTVPVSSVPLDSVDESVEMVKEMVEAGILVVQ